MTGCSACRTSTTCSRRARPRRRDPVPPGGIIQSHAHEVLAGAHALLERIAGEGLLEAVEHATFGDVSRTVDGGRGLDGIVTTSPDYFNPVVELMMEPANA